MAPLAVDQFILDSWPVVEWFHMHQPVTSLLDQLLERAIHGSTHLTLSRINYGEVIYSCRKRMPSRTVDRLLADFKTLPIEMVSVSDAQVDQALKSQFSLSFADCFAAALAIERNAPLVTGDPEYRMLEDAGLLQLHWLGA